VSEYSQEMRQRLGIAACLVRNPKLMVLDELGIAIAAVGPIVYLMLAIAQGYPHAPLADNFGPTGVAFSLVVFKLIVVIGPAVIASLIAGDIVAAEDLGGNSRRS
jgi:hypothetical protein